jgi:capsular polysaccharide transport system permease protein
MPDASLLLPVAETGPPDAARDCRLAEALLHQGRAEEAAACCRRAWPSVGDDPDLLRICGWVFSNAACPAEAAAAYRRLIDRCPEWIAGHRHLSAALAAAGRSEEALVHAIAASEGAPEVPEFALHAAALLVAAERREEAARYIDRALPDAGGDPRLLADAAELLMQCGHAAAAARVLAGAASDSCGESRLLRVLSAAEMLCGRPEAALAAIDRALALAPEDAEYHLHRGHLLWRIDDLEGAAREFDGVAARDPGGRAVTAAQMGLYRAAGRLREATAAGGELLRAFPDDRGSAEAVLHLLNHRLDTLDGEDVVPAGDRGRRPPRPSPGPGDRLRTQRRVIRALILRETRTRFADYKLGYGWALIEPILHIALLSVMFAVLMHGRPPIGRHFFLFYYTGLVPYLMFVHTSSGMCHAITGNAALLHLPPVTSFDAIAARGLLEIMTDLVVAAILFAGFWALGLAGPPDDLWGPSLALLATAALGCGLGCVNAVMTALWRSWEKAYNQVTRVLYFISGTFYVPAMMPQWARHALAWNPLLHAIDWFRAGFFASYRPHWLDRPYLAIVATLALLAGLALQHGCRRRLSAPR